MKYKYLGTPSAKGTASAVVLKPKDKNVAGVNPVVSSIVLLLSSIVWLTTELSIAVLCAIPILPGCTEVLPARVLFICL